MSPDGEDGTRPCSFLARRFGTKEARFRCAVALGFLVVAVGSLAGAPGARRLVADESLWPFASLFGRVAQPAERSTDVAFVPLRRRSLQHGAHRHLWRSPRVAALPAPVPLGRQSVCVRTCDGYAFPVGAYHGDGDRASHESACQAACPDAKTALYVLPGGTDHLAEAVNVATGRLYSALPDAYHYTTVLDDACTCHRPGRASRTLSVLRDLTLRRGDAVMTARGFRVFHGAARFPYRRTDFLALSRSRDVAKANRPTFSALEKESLKAPLTAQAPAPPAAAMRDGALPGNGA